MKESEFKQIGDIATSLSYFSRLGVHKDARILDIGTRYGSFLSGLKQSGYEFVFGIDTNADAIHQGVCLDQPLRGRLMVYEGMTLPFVSDAFDVVTMFDVIEHIPNANRYLKEVVRILKPGGRLIFQTPNKYTNIPWEIIQYRSLTKWRNYHCSLQTLRSLHRILEEAGFQDITIEKFGLCTEYKITLARKKLGILGPFLLRSTNPMPLAIFPNFWGHCVKPE